MSSSRHLVFALLSFSAVFAAPVTYDQRQTGDLNVNVHLKDVKIVALVDSELLEEYTDYDYFYDYADFTIKPITTSSTTSVEPWNTWPTNPPSSTEKTELPAVTGSVIGQEDKETEGASSTEVYSSTTVTEEKNETQSTSGKPVQQLRSRKRCRSGYSPDGKGRCRRVNQRASLLPFAMKLAPRLLEEVSHNTKKQSS